MFQLIFYVLQIGCTLVSESSPISALASYPPIYRYVGILNNCCRTINSPITCVNPPPKFSTSIANCLAFSIDAVLSGIIPLYSVR
jgi:hypothetical protein